MATRKTTTRRASGSKTIKVLLGAFGSEPQEITVPTGSTVDFVLYKARIDLGAETKVWLNGAKVEDDTKVKKGDVITIISPKEAGV